MSRKRLPIGARGRWREGRARRVEAARLAELEQQLERGIAARISELARQADIATTELAAALEVDPSMVSRWIGGRATPSLRRLLGLALALNCSLADLLPNEAHLP